MEKKGKEQRMGRVREGRESEERERERENRNTREVRGG